VGKKNDRCSAHQETGSLETQVGATPRRNGETEKKKKIKHKKASIKELPEGERKKAGRGLGTIGKLDEIKQVTRSKDSGEAIWRRGRIYEKKERDHDVTRKTRVFSK